MASKELPILGILNPRLAMAGLNPHAGEDGVLGDEETRIVVPAIKAARATGIEISGPFPADTVYLSALRGDFDAVVACYHDQGIIPVKLIAFGKAVNVTLGLPIIRTSVDHGTAFDIAGRGVADASSMVEAILLAARFVLMKSTRENQQ
jgi:4-hydroxythreonine-4-phosphate dehydrogenase